MLLTRHRVVRLAVATGCAAGSPTGASDTGTRETGAATPGSDINEAATVTPRLVLTYDGGLQVLDATTLELVSDLELDGFNRVNAAGDGRHALVSTVGGFRLLDAGTAARRSPSCSPRTSASTPMCSIPPRARHTRTPTSSTS